jgi:hypothetical protein
MSHLFALDTCVNHQCEQGCIHYETGKTCELCLNNDICDYQDAVMKRAEDWEHIHNGLKGELK